MLIIQKTGQRIQEYPLLWKAEGFITTHTEPGGIHMSRRSAAQHEGGVLEAEGAAEFSGIHAEIMMGPSNAERTIMKLNVEFEKGAPAHISKGEDKIFIVLDGSVLFLVGAEKRPVAKGDIVFVPKGQVHSFSGLERAGASMALLSTPARHHDFFARMGALQVPHDPADVQRICEDLEQEIVGPVVLSANA